MVMVTVMEQLMVAVLLLLFQQLVNQQVSLGIQGILIVKSLKKRGNEKKNVGRKSQEEKSCSTKKAEDEAAMAKPMPKPAEPKPAVKAKPKMPEAKPKAMPYTLEFLIDNSTVTIEEIEEVNEEDLTQLAIPVPKRHQQYQAAAAAEKRRRVGRRE